VVVGSNPVSPIPVSPILLNVASTAAFQPVPAMAVYAASKAFVLSFTEALWEETRGSGVRVLALCPGATETRFFEVAGTEFMTQGRQTPEHVAAVGLRAFDSGRGPSVVSGVANRMLASGYRIMPRAAMVAAGTKECAPCAYITTLSDDGRWLAKGAAAAVAASGTISETTLSDDGGRGQRRTGTLHLMDGRKTMEHYGRC
jgi:NAD(P)-dependent dehydrogenase (short-subunit alcohol dehydrogenase family)